MKIKVNNILKGDKVIWAVYAMFIFISIVEVFSAMNNMVIHTSGYNYISKFAKHCSLIFAGFLVCFIVHKINYIKLSKYMNVLLAVAIGLLVYTLLAADKGEIAARWISIPIIGLGFQPSEIAKYFIILYVAQQIAVNQNKIDSKEVFWKLMIPIIIICFLIFWANFSTAALIFITCFIILLTGGVNRKYLYRTLLVIAAGLVLLVILGIQFPEIGRKIGRLATMISRMAGYGNNDYTQITQQNLALMAVSTGGLSGRGIGNSQMASFLDEGHNDFIYSIILEEGGIWLGIFIILLYLILLNRIFKTAKDKAASSGYFGSLICFGFGFVITLQAFINMGVAVGLLPVTGQTLPFISYGGTSFIFASALLGIIINISYNDLTADKTEQQQTENTIQEDESNH